MLRREVVRASWVEVADSRSAAVVVDVWFAPAVSAPVVRAVVGLDDDDDDDDGEEED